MYDFLMLVAAFCAITFPIAVVALFKPIPALWLSNRTRATRVCAATFVCFFLFVFFATRFKEEQSNLTVGQGADWRTNPVEESTEKLSRPGAYYLREMLLDPPAEMCGGFHNVLQKNRLRFPNRPEQRLVQLTVTLMVKMLEDNSGVLFEYTEDEYDQLATMFQRQCGVLRGHE